MAKRNDFFISFVSRVFFYGNLQSVNGIKIRSNDTFEITISNLMDVKLICFLVSAGYRD